MASFRFALRIIAVGACVAVTVACGNDPATNLSSDLTPTSGASDRVTTDTPVQGSAEDFTVLVSQQRGVNAPDIAVYDMAALQERARAVGVAELVAVEPDDREFAPGGESAGAITLRGVSLVWRLTDARAGTANRTFDVPSTLEVRVSIGEDVPSMRDANDQNAAALIDNAPLGVRGVLFIGVREDAPTVTIEDLVVEGRDGRALTMGQAATRDAGVTFEQVLEDVAARPAA